MVAVTRRNLSQGVADELLRLIRAGELRPGERLPTERGLMELYNVGRNTVREAVRALAVQGIVDVRPGRGATVLAISTDQALDAEMVAALLSDQAVNDLYEFRRLIEVETAGRAAERAEAGDVAALQQALDTYLHAYKEMLPTWNADVAYHRMIAAASHNVVYESVLDAVNDRLLAARRETQRSPAVLARAEREHRAIFEAIRDHDPGRARSAMSEHIDSAVWALEEARKQAARLGATRHHGSPPHRDGRSPRRGR
ncbi:MAG TPA: FadR/GntR family transcriptional regulator [Acidimicrobiales bacterium]|nr:FadR/GntR family transcriptional regulator [Acidimicrobiales bacterium]